MRIAKVISAVVGVLMVAGSVAMIAGGTFLVAATDDGDGFISAPPVRVRTNTAALVGDDIEIFFNEPVRGGAFLGIDDIKARLAVNARNGKPLFVGIGPSSEVAGYLAGGSYSTVEHFGDDVIFSSVGGSADLQAPGEQTFWVTSTVDDVLNWSLESGRWSVVLMNQDGTTGIDSSVIAAGRVPFLQPVGAAILVVGLIGLVVGVALTYFGVKSEPGTATPPQVQAEPVPVT